MLNRHGGIQLPGQMDHQEPIHLGGIGQKFSTEVVVLLAIMKIGFLSWMLRVKGPVQ